MAMGSRCLALPMAVLAALLATHAGAGRTSAVLKEVADVPCRAAPHASITSASIQRRAACVISHMGDGHLVVFDTRADRVIANHAGVSHR